MSTKQNTIEAYGVKGMKSTPWRREFKNADALTVWAENNSAEVLGIRDLEGVRHEEYANKNGTVRLTQSGGPC